MSLPKDLLSLTPWVGPCGPSRRRSPFAPIAPDSGPSFCRAAPESPMVGRRTPLPHSSSFSLKPLPGGAVRPGCEENHERSRKGVSLWSAPSSDLRPPSLMAAPLYSPPSPITSVPTPLLWIRVTRRGVRMQVTGLQPKTSDPEVYTSGAWEFEFLKNSIG